MLQSGLNTFELYNNIFTNNICLGNGGLFSLTSTYHNFTAINNTYISNSAAVSGGIGYTFKSKLSLYEKKWHIHKYLKMIYGASND